LTGEFDNFQQHFEAKETKAPAPHGRIHTVISPIDAPSIGSHVLLARESALDDPERLASLHLYSLVAEPGGTTVTLRLYSFADAAEVTAAFAKSGRAADLPLDRARAMPGCEVTWRREGDALVGSMAPGSCRATWPKTGTQVTITNSYRVTADQFWFSETLTDQSGQVLFGRTDGVPFKLMRARPFTCWAALRRDGAVEQYDGMRDVEVHDQGKWIAFRDEQGNRTKYAFELSQLRYGQKVPVLKLAVYEEGRDQAVAYSWADPKATRIGINLRWFQVGCTAK
jgi:hypothetical protein